MKVKKILSLFLCMAMLSCVVPLSYASADTVTDGYLTYEISDGSATVTFCDRSITDELVIPDTVSGYPVTAIGESAFLLCRDLKSVIIPSSVTIISDKAFDSCSAITSVVIPETVITIGAYAFNSCTSLKCIEFPESVTTIGDYAFHNCNSLTKVVIPDSVTYLGDYVFSSCDELESISFGSNVPSIGGDVFSFCGMLTEVNIGCGVTAIATDSFSYCDSLTTVNVDEDNTSYSSDNGILVNKDKTELLCYPKGRTDSTIEIPDGISVIGERAFFNCNNLTDIVIPNGVTSIGEEAFYLCSKLGDVVFPDSLTSIGRAAFSGCSLLDDVYLPDNIIHISREAFSNCDRLSNIKLPENLETIGLYAFSGCDNLAILRIPESVTDIASFAFHFSGLMRVTMYNNIKTIGDRAFLYCDIDTIYYSGSEEEWNNIDIYFDGGSNSILEECTIVYNHTPPPEVDSALCYIFSDGEAQITKCYNKKRGEIVIPEFIGEYPVTGIKDSAFSGCSLLTGITIPEGVETVGSYAFSGCDRLINISVPASVQEIGENAFYNCSVLEAISVDSNNLYYTSQDGVLFDKDKSLLICYPMEKADKDYTIPDSVTIVGDYAFYDCWNLKNLSFSDSVTQIGNYAFCYAGIETVKLSKSLKDIGRYAFLKCLRLTEIIIPDSVDNIGIDAFRDCDNLIIYCKYNSFADGYAQSNSLSRRIIGDTTEDYIISSDDLINFRKALLGIDTYTQAVLDCNIDSSFDVVDLVKLKKWIAQTE